MGRKSREKREAREQAEANDRRAASGGSPAGGTATASDGRNLMAFWIIGIVILLVAVGAVLFTQYADDSASEE